MPANKICIVGASTVWGASDTEGGGWVDRLKRNLYNGQLGSNLTYNLGISGGTTSMQLERLEGELKPRRPDVVIFAVGTNDSRYINSEDNPEVDLDTFKKNLRKLVNISKNFTNNIVFVGPVRVDESKTTPWLNGLFWKNERILTYSKTVEDFCGESNYHFISMFDVIDESELHDGLHPNSEGHRKIFEKVKSELEILGLI